MKNLELMKRFPLQIKSRFYMNLITLLIIVPSILFAQEEKEKQVDKLLEKWDTPNYPGCAITIVKDSEIIYKKCFGQSNLEYDIPITSSTVFHAASVSKQFTAFAIALLVKENRLSLDDDICKYLPELPDFGQTITIRHLLHHTSGLREQYTLLKISGVEVVDWISNDHVLKLVQQQKELNFNPGDEIVYCNTGYTLLAEIVERVSGQTFNEFTTEKIFKPLGMDHTFFYDDLQRIVKNKAYPYIMDTDENFYKGILNYTTVGATGLTTTIDDMVKWIMNFSQYKVGDRNIIEQMFTSGLLNNGEETTYGFGLGITDYQGLKYVLHSGHDAGYRSYVGYFPEQKFGIVILGNVGSVNGMDLGRKIADIYLKNKFVPSETKSDEPPAASEEMESKKPFTLKKKQLWEFSGRYYSEELKTEYRIIVQDGQLVATHIRNGDVVLAPVKKDQFTGDQWWFRNISYFRDENDKIIGFRLTSGRVRNLVFNRIK